MPCICDSSTTGRRACSGPGPGKCAACLPLTGLPPAPLWNRLLYLYRGRAARRALRRADAWLLGSRAIHESYLALGLLRAGDAVHVVPYGVELATPAHRTPRAPRAPGAPLACGVIGSLLPHKGAHVAAAAFAGIDRATARLTVWGDPAADPAYAREVERAGAGRVEVRGRFAEAEKPAIFAGLDLLIVSLRQPTDGAVHDVHREIRAPVLYLPEYLSDDPARVRAGRAVARRLPGHAAAEAAYEADLARDPSPSRRRRWGQAAVLAAELPADVGALYVHYLHTPASVAYYTHLMTGIPWSTSAHAKDIWITSDWEKREKLQSMDWLVTCTETGHRALAALAGDELAHGREGVEILDDHPRVEHRLAAFHHQAGHLAQGIGGGDGGVVGPDVFLHELVVELFLGHHHPHLADVGAGCGSDQFHGVASSARWSV